MASLAKESLSVNVEQLLEKTKIDSGEPGFRTKFWGSREGLRPDLSLFNQPGKIPRSGKVPDGDPGLLIQDNRVANPLESPDLGNRHPKLRKR